MHDALTTLLLPLAKPIIAFDLLELIIYLYISPPLVLGIFSSSPLVLLGIPSFASDPLVSPPLVLEIYRSSGPRRNPFRSCNPSLETTHF
jgi:hypothetical protein